MLARPASETAPPRGRKNTADKDGFQLKGVTPEDEDVQ